MCMGVYKSRQYVHSGEVELPLSLRGSKRLIDFDARISHNAYVGYQVIFDHDIDRTDWWGAGSVNKGGAAQHHSYGPSLAWPCATSGSSSRTKKIQCRR